MIYINVKVTKYDGRNSGRGNAMSLDLKIFHHEEESQGGWG